LVDLLSLYRDVMTIQLGTNSALINAELEPQIRVAAQASTEPQTIQKIEAINMARKRIDSNVRDLVALEALAVSLRIKK
jgi:DNA polymerase-3 subunit delta'